MIDQATFKRVQRIASHHDPRCKLRVGMVKVYLKGEESDLDCTCAVDGHAGKCRKTRAFRPEKAPCTCRGVRTLADVEALL